MSSIKEFNDSSEMPCVSILMITYNHAQFISQALESILSQKTAFTFEIVIGEDSSSDSTREIIENYKNRYPQTINLLPSDKRYGAHQNFARTYAACKGKYIAILEGDDYWIDDNKLQVQVELLDSRTELSGCFHHVKKISMPENIITDFWPESPSGDVDVSTLLKTNQFHTTALMFRNSSFPNGLPDVILNCNNSDYALYVTLADIHPLGYINKSMSVYRVHDNGRWSSLSFLTRHIECIKTLSKIDISLGYKYHKQIKKNISRLYIIIIKNKLIPHNLLNALIFIKNKLKMRFY